MKYILASASPRRRELLKEIVPEFDIVPYDGEEKIDKNLSPEDAVLALACAKCDNIFALHSDSVVIGCDTVVVFGGKILGKPKDAEDAENTLKALSGKTHTVITGVCVRSPLGRREGIEKTEVIFNELTEEFIKSYVAGGSPLDKAGSYGIQDGGIVKDFRGSYTNVVGMPVELVRKFIGEL